MCQPCTTATERTTTKPDSQKRRTRKPTRLEQLKRTATAALQALGTFDFLMTEECWWTGARDGSAEAETLAAEFEAAGHLIAGASAILGKRYPKCFWDDEMAPHTYGSYLRYAARLMDELDRDTGMVGGYTDDKNLAYHLYEVCPHLLHDRSAGSPSNCPLCGSNRELKFFFNEDGVDDLRAWVCFTCEGNVRKAKKVLESQRWDPKQPKKKAKRSQTKEKATPAPATPFGLPWLGEIDCRTDEEKAADEVAGIAPPQAFFHEPPKSKAGAKPKKAPALHNRLAGVN